MRVNLPCASSRVHTYSKRGPLRNCGHACTLRETFLFEGSTFKLRDRDISKIIFLIFFYYEFYFRLNHYFLLLINLLTNFALSSLILLEFINWKNVQLSYSNYVINLKMI